MTEAEIQKNDAAGRSSEKVTGPDLSLGSHLVQDAHDAFKSMANIVSTDLSKFGAAVGSVEKDPAGAIKSLFFGDSATDGKATAGKSGIAGAVEAGMFACYDQAGSLHFCQNQ